MAAISMSAISPLQIVSLSLSSPLPHRTSRFCSRSTRTIPPFIRNANSYPNSSTRHFLIFAGGNGDGDGDGDDGLEKEEEERREPPAIDLRRWRDLLSPDPENIAAVGLTGLLTWASVQALFQLVFISFAILLAALKYSFIAVLLLFIVITLL